MPQFLFLFVVLVASTSLPIILSLNSPHPSDETDAETLQANLLQTNTEHQSTTPTQTSTLPPLTDIETHWAKAAITALYEKQIVSGYPNGRFGPDDSLTRAQIIKMSTKAFPLTPSTFTNADSTRPVSRAEALKIILESAGFTQLTPEGPNFTDVDSVRDWFAKYTAFAKKAQLTAGYSDGSFRGNQPITRGESCVLLQKVIDYLAGDV